METTAVVCAIISAYWTVKPWRAILWIKKRWRRWRVDEEFVDYEYDALTRLYLGRIKPELRKGKQRRRKIL